VAAAPVHKKAGKGRPGAQGNVSRFYRPELDALRFLAFFFVYLSHVLLNLDISRYTGFKARLALAEETVHESMAYGVCLFFFLSSYLITALLTKERETTGTVHIQSFYVRRMLRIWPLYFAFIGISLVIAIFVPAARPSKGQVIALLVLMGNWYTAHLDWAGASQFSALWSISVEEQFYVLFPAMAKFGGRRLLYLLCPMAVVMSFVTVYWLKLQNVGWYYGIWTNSLAQFQFFAFGALAALLLRGRIPHPGKWQRVALFLAGFVFWFGSRARSPLPTSPAVVAIGYLLVALGCLCFFFSAYGIAASRIPQWLRYLGKISYGLYIFHGVALHLLEYAVHSFRFAQQGRSYFVFGAIGDVLALPLTITMAALSYKYLESPFLRLKGRFEFVKSRPA
jgi:peptidoglycan/LPS O-acetylase OafA/YrhL